MTNPDAEGRLILADALWYARRQGATHVVDLATLTGAMRAGMGDLYGGVFANDENWRAAVVDAGNAVGDLAWPWPLHPRYRRLLESRVADLRNTSGRPYGYPIIAATFLERFAGDGPWAHVDMLGPALLDDDRGDAFGTGRQRLRRAHARRARLAPGRASAHRGSGARRVHTPAVRGRRRRTTHRPVGELVRLRRVAGRDDVSWWGENRQTGSVAAASPVSRSAWQRQPPKSSSWRPSGQDRHGSCIQSVPRKRLNASDSCQIHSSERVAHVRELEAGDRRGRLARERLAVRRHDDRVRAPAAHARLRQVLVVVGQHPEDRDPRADALAEALHRLLAALELLARRHQRRAG